MVQIVLNRAIWEAWYRQQPENQRQTYEKWAGPIEGRVVPLGRWRTPENIAAMAIFFSGSKASWGGVG